MKSDHSAAIVVEGLSKAVVTHGIRRTILSNISFQIAAGELVVVLGENGAGKTTFLKLLARLAVPDQGAIRSLANIAYCGLGDRSFYYRLSLAENLNFFAGLLGLQGARKAKKIFEVIEITDIGSALSQRFAEASSGIRQRLALARTLLQDPDIILFDEPTRAIDPQHAQQLRLFMTTVLKRDLHKTIVVASNILEEARELADRIVMIAKGTLYEIPTLDMDLSSWMRNIIEPEGSLLHG